MEKNYLKEPSKKVISPVYRNLKSFWILGALLMLSQVLIAQSQGPLYPGNDGNAGGGTFWNNTNRIVSDNNQYATVALTGTNTSRALYGTDYGFTIPGAAVITGIQVQIERFVSSTFGGNSVNDLAVRLIKNNTIQGNNNAVAGDWTTTNTVITYGGATDMWGLTFTPADINSNQFGACISVQNQGSNRTASVDYIRITVFYTLGPTITNFTPTSACAGTTPTVTITGTNFTGATAVNFNGVSAAFTVVSATQITATVPSGATTGPISVTAPGGTATSASNFTITPLPSVQPITGTLSTCVTGTTTLADATPGGVWSSATPLLASVDGSGVVTGLAPGTATIIYTVTSAGCSNSVSANVTVNARPDLGGASSVCIGSTTQLTPTSGGTWVSNDPAVATIDNAGNITTVSPGMATFTFTDSTTGCSRTTGTFTVFSLPAITADPAPQSVCSGSAASFTVNATGSGLSYQWYNGATMLSNAGNISGADAATLTINPVDLADASANYYCIVSGACAPAATSNSASLTVTEQVIITSQPLASQTFCTGAAASFSVGATGSGLTYQWYNGMIMLTDGGMISGATSATLTISSLTLADASATYYCIVSGVSPCTAVTSANAELIVNESPIIVSNPVALNTVCDDDPVSLSILATGGSLTYQWYKGATPLADGGNISGATTNTLNFTPIYTSDAATDYYCVVTNACTSISSTLAEVVVNLKPKIPAQNTTVCSDLPFAINPVNGVPDALTVVPAGTTYSWAAPVVTGGMTGGVADSGQPSISGTLNNPTNTPQTATYTVTPTSGTTGNCVGIPFTVVVTVDPVPSVINTITSTCSGTTAIVTPTDGGGNIVPVGTTYAWSTPSVTGGLTGWTAETGQSSFNQTLINPTNTVQSATYSVTATSGSCVGSTFIINVNVQPKPDAAGTPATQSICAGDAISPIVISNPNGVTGITSFSWTRDNGATITGIPTSGTGSVISGNLTHSLGTPQTTTFTITAVSEESCVSDPITVDVIVNPIPMPVASTTTQTVCSGANFTTVNLTTSNSVPSTTFTWTRDNDTNLTGLPATGSGSSISGALTNITSTPQTTTFTVTASANGCSSTTTFAITVNPQPTLSVSPASQTVCGGLPFGTIIASNPNTVAGVSYNWTRNNTANVTGVAAFGAGATVSGTLVNTTGTTQTVTFSFTASAAGCSSSTMTADVIVEPTPLLVLTPATHPNICSGAAITNIVLSNTNNVPGTTYSWTRDNTTNITGIAASGTGSPISGNLTNNTTTNQTTTFTVTATAPNGCAKTSTISITVYAPLVAPVIGSSQTVCLFSTPAALTQTTPVSGGSGTYSYQWQRSTDGVSGWVNVGGNTASYTPGTINGGPNYYYRVVVTNVCGTVTSNVVLIQVVNNVGFTFSLTGTPGTICPGTSFSPGISSIHSDDAAVRYRWTADPTYITPGSGGPIGTTGGAFWFIVWLRTSSSTFNFTAQNNTNATVVTPISITPDIYDYPGPPSGGFQCSITPQVFNVTIRPRPVATIVSPVAASAFCSGTSPNVTVSGNITDANMTFNWTRNNTVNVTSPTNSGTSGAIAPGGTFTIPFVLTNATGAVQNVTYTITPSSNGCTGTPVTVTIAVQPQVTPGTVTASQSVCLGGDPAAFTQTVAATGINLTYQWYSSTTSATGPWTLIPGQTGTTYDAPGPINQNTWFVREVTSTVNGNPCSVLNTTPILVSVNTIVPGTIGGDQTICSGGGATITSTAAATGSGTITYSWQSNTTGCGGTWNNIAGATATLTVTGLTQTTYFRRVATSTVSGSPCQNYSNCVTITVNNVTGGTVGTDEVLCGTNPAAFTVLAAATGSGVLTYQWQSNTTGCGSLTWTNIPGATGATYDAPSGLTQTTYYRRVTTSTLNSVSCTAISNCITVTANAVTGGAISGNRTVCSGGDPAAFTEVVAATGVGLTYQWQSSTISASGPWTDITGATGNTYDAPAPINQTTYFQRVAFATVGATTCQATSNFVTVFVNNVTASVIAGDQSVCSEDPSAFTVTTPASGSGTVSYQWQSNTTGCGGIWTNIVGATSATYDPPVLTQTRYYRVVITSTMNSVACTAISNCVTVTSFAKTWNGSVNSDWNVAANWTPNGVPTSSHCVVIPNVANDAVIMGSGYIGYAKNITVLNGGELEIEPSNSVVVEDALAVNAGGDVEIYNNASLVQVNNVANTGTVRLQRITQPMYRFDYTYWNSPMVMGTYTLGNLSPNTQYDKYYSWNPTNAGGNGNWIQESTATIMNPSKGYIVRAPNSFSTNPAITATYTATFTGTPNNGDIQIPIAIGSLGAGTSNDKMNLIGNPYPSAVSANAFLNDPVNVPLIDGTIYFWTHHTPPSTAFPNPFYGNFIYNYSPAGYASYNKLGGTYTVPSGYGGNPPNGFIGAGQGFFVKGLGNGNAVFKNSMRVTGNNNVFFRPANPYASTPTEFESHRIWLNMADTQGSFSQILVGYAEGATNELDRGFDGETFNVNAVSLYSVNSGKVLGIQGRALPFNDTDTVQLGYSSTVARAFTIGIDRVDGLFENQNIYLEDKQLNVIHDLKESAYTFNAQPGADNDRFVLRYTSSSLGTGHNDASTGVLAYVQHQKLVVKASQDIEEVAVFDISGKLVTVFTPDQNSTSLQADFNAAQGVYFAKIKLANGGLATVKLVNGK